MIAMISDCVKDLSQDKRNRLVQQVRRWGDLNTDAILDPACKLFSTPGIEGCIGYRTEASCAIAFGDPLSAPGDQVRLADAFQCYCRDENLNLIYALVSEQFIQAVPNLGYRIQFGDKLILNPCDDPLKKTGPNGVLVRKKVKHASNEGLVVSEYLTDDPGVEKEIEQVGNAWLQARRGPQIYIARPSPFDEREGKRWFYAKQENRIVGFLILNEIQSCSGWLLNNLIITPHAPSGTSELLITSALKTLEMERCHCVEIGPVVAADLPRIDGLGTFSAWFVRKLFKAVKRFYHLDGQTMFWEKFQPQKEPSYLMFDKINYRTIRALMRALNAL